MSSEEIVAEQNKRQRSLCEQRESLFSRVQRSYVAFQNLKADDVPGLKLRYERMLTAEQNFESVQDKIREHNAQLVSSVKPLEVDKVQASFEDMFYAAHAIYLTAVGHTQKEQPAVVSPTFNVPVNTLPVIAIPVFSGEISSWTEFYSLFKSLIDENAALNEVQKFHYLRSSLKGTALAAISGFQISSENYALALQALVIRYQNKRLLASLYIQQILEFTPLKSSSHAGLQQFLRVHRNSIDALKALSLKDLADFLLLSLSLTNLDTKSRKAFENKHSSHSTPTYRSLIDFIEEQSRTLELCGLDTQSPASSSTKTSPVSSSTKTSPAPKRINSLFAAKQATLSNPDSPAPANATSARHPSCPVCKLTHAIHRCPEFLKQSVDEKYRTLQRLQRCFNCMGFHIRSECTSKGACLTCKSIRHHTLLHPVQASLPSEEPSADVSPSKSVASTPQSLACQVRTAEPIQRTALLGTVRALIRDSQGQLQPFRAVIDSGSQISAITHSLAQRLGLRIHSGHSELSGIGHATARAYGTVHCNIVSRLDPEASLQVQALVLSTIASHLPTSPVPQDIFQRLHGLPLADDQFHVPNQIDFLIGADLYPNILQRTGETVIVGSPSAINTLFGWVVLGSVDSSERASPLSPVSLFALSVPLDRTLRLFWETEEVTCAPQVDPEDQHCEEHFLASHKRDSSGRYSVALPFRISGPSLGLNREAALQNYLSLERRLKRNPEHCDAYQKFMQEYGQSQHMQLARNPSNYVIPHHCVHKVTSSSTKLRVVFNASAPDVKGISLNQLLMSGPKLQGELPCILTNFRTHPIAICADIRQMYRQILVHPSDRVYQHIFWRPNSHSPVEEYELNTVTYGLTPSAYLAQRVLRQVVSDEGAEFPLASQAVTAHTYIDDIVSGAEDISQARDLQSQLQALLARGGFELRKWASNNPAALSALPEEHLESPLVFSDEEQGIKILGLLWDPRSDDFSFQTQPFEGQVTKRAALSYIARIFDPLGFLTPFVCWMKMFIQQLWLSQIQWDDVLSDTLTQSWLSAVADVSQLSNFRVPRAFPDSRGTHRLVGFCDASEKGYAAVLYLHTQSECSTSHVSLLRAKSKVSPVKPMTIPKLELSAALLLSRLLVSTVPSLSSVAVDSVTLYTDSQIVLAWLATPPHRLKTFVANRVVEVLENSSPTNWAHVPSEENPADCASRGLLPSQLLDHPLWLTGPSFLFSPHHAWPKTVTFQNPCSELPEVKPEAVVLVAQIAVDPLLIHMRKFSSLLKVQRVFGYVIRFVRIIQARRARVPTPTGPLRPAELQDALDLCIKVTQQHYYAAEIRQLALQRQVSSRLVSLNPYLDPAGILRVGGRLRHSSLPEDARHPFLLPKEAHLSSLVCDAYHKSSLHSGPRAVQALILQRYWIVSLRGLLRQRIHRCLTCHKFRAKPLQPQMADLPPSRVQQSRAFSHVGTDFAGPFQVKSSNRRKAPTTKGYLCLFVCMASKAVHLEMVSELTTEAFLACFDRFLSRRGLPDHIYSDCGRNFVGAARHLKEVHEFLSRSETTLFDALATREIHWHFNPPYAPNFGGLWEAGVKSAKGILHRLISDTPHTYEEYATLFARIEAVLNSRPLCSTSNDPSEGADYLSPGHFLIGAPLLSPPEQTEPDHASHLTRWHRVRQLHQTFWARWSTEYLHTQMQRGKWVRGNPNLQVGDTVFFYDAASSPLSWPIGRVEQLLPGRDGIVRVVSIRTATGVYTRPVNKLVSLPSA